MEEYIECIFCGSKVGIEEAGSCEVCGDWFCGDCIRENEIGEEVCYSCVEEG